MKANSSAWAAQRYTNTARFGKPRLHFLRSVGDEIVSLNGLQMKSKELLAEVADRMAPGDRVWLQIVRRNRLRRIDFELVAEPVARCRIERIPSPTNEQAAVYRSWLGLHSEREA